MTITTSGSLAMSAIQSEFGGTNPISMSEYYAGGALVPSGVSGVNGAIPSSGQVSMSKYYGASSSGVSLNPNYTTGWTGVILPPTNTYAYFYLMNDGTIKKQGREGSTFYSLTTLGNWITNSALVSQYEAYFEVYDSSAGINGPQNTWTNLGSSLTWFLRTNVSLEQYVVYANAYLYIRAVGSSTNIASTQIHFEAQTG